MAPIRNMPTVASSSRQPYDEREKQLIASFYAGGPETSQNVDINGYLFVSNEQYEYEANFDIIRTVTRDVLEWPTAPEVKVTYYTDLTAHPTQYIRTEFLNHDRNNIRFTDIITNLRWENSLIIEVTFDEGTIDLFSGTQKMWFQIEDRNDGFLGQNYVGLGRAEALDLLARS